MSGDPQDGIPALLPALRVENLRLRKQVEQLTEQVSALQRVHRELVSSPSFRLTAPARRVQEKLRLAKQARRLAQQREHFGATPSGQLVGLVPPVVGPIELANHPLLARTAAWARGTALEAPVRMTSRERGAGDPRVLVIAHVFYTEVWAELAERISRIPEAFDLVVTLVSGRSDGLADEVLAAFPAAMVEIVDNRGRDMLPLIEVIDLGLVGDYDAVLKVHTKKSAHRRDGARWRNALTDALLPSPAGIALTLELLRRDPSIGMVAPVDNIMGAEFWGSNAAMIEAIAARVPLGFDPQKVWFAAGSMFWTRPLVLSRLAEPNLTAEDFEYEIAALDGTTAHALERYIGVIVADEGLRVVSTDEIAGLLAQVV